MKKALHLYKYCAGPFYTYLRFPYEGDILDQPAKLLTFFDMIQYYLDKKEDNKKVEQEQREFKQRMRTINSASGGRKPVR